MWRTGGEGATRAALVWLLVVLDLLDLDELDDDEEDEERPPCDSWRDDLLSEWKVSSFSPSFVGAGWGS